MEGTTWEQVITHFSYRQNLTTKYGWQRHSDQHLKAR